MFLQNGALLVWAKQMIFTGVFTVVFIVYIYMPVLWAPVAFGGGGGLGGEEEDYWEKGMGKELGEQEGKGVGKEMGSRSVLMG